MKPSRLPGSYGEMSLPILAELRKKKSILALLDNSPQGRDDSSFMCRMTVAVALWLACMGFSADAAPFPPPSTQPATQPASPPGDLVLSTWAATGSLNNPTALSFDRRGRAYVAQTLRREGGELQTRTDPEHRVIPDHTFRTVEDRARWAGDGDPEWGKQIGGKMETISRLEDSTRSGHSDRATVFYQGFNHNECDVLAGVLFFENSVYATCAPDLWLLRDTHGLGTADEIRSLSHGYAVHMSYSGHNMHGLTVGPDGKIYFTIGDKALNVTTPDGRQLIYPFCGSCLRCNPDGSDLEVFAYGLRNTFEIAFDKFGNLFSVDNDGDFPTERERLVYITEGSDSGWRYHWQYRTKNYDVAVPVSERRDRYNVWLAEKLWVPHFAGQAAYVTPALANYTDGPCGFKYASEGCLNERFAGHFFVDEFPKATIRSFAVEPKGAYFTLADDKIVSRGVQCTGLAFGPDGALYGCEWGKSGFKLGNTGSVIKLDDPAAAETNALRRETRGLIENGPYGKSIDDLIQLLGHADMRVRLDAQLELVRRKSIAPLIRVAFEPGAAQMARIHAMWGIGQFVNARSIDANSALDVQRRLIAACDEAHAEIRAQSIKLLGEVAGRGITPDAGCVPTAIRLLNDPSLRARFFAAMALGKFNDRSAVAPLLKLCGRNRPVDSYIRHAAVMGLVGIGDADALEATASDPSSDARLAAVVALRRLHRPGVARFLADRDEFVATEAARAIHDDDSIPDALPALARAAVERGDITNEAFVRRALNANLRLGGGEQIATLLKYASDARNPSAMRVEAIEMLANWEAPAVNDRVEGCYRAWPVRSGIVVRHVVEPMLPALLASSASDVARATAALADRLELRTADGLFAGWVSDSSIPAGSRAAALKLLANHKYPKLAGSIDAALSSGEPALRVEAMGLLALSDPPRSVREIDQSLTTGKLAEKQSAVRLLGAMHNGGATSRLAELLDHLISGNVAPELQLDVLEAAESAKNAGLDAKRARYDQSLVASDPLAKFASTLHGGDADRGRDIFTAHSDAACVRCHSIDATGSTVGPNLAGIGSKPDKPRRYLLESLINPNAYVVPGFGMASFTLKNGSETSGIVKSEDDRAVQLLGLEGEATTLKKSEIVSRTAPASMMPAMGAVLSPYEIRDVIEYLSSLKKPGTR